MEQTHELPIDIMEETLRRVNHNDRINIVPFRICGNRTKYSATDGNGYWFPLDHRFTPGGIMVRPATIQERG